jgi:hypothetical protein
MLEGPYSFLAASGGPVGIRINSNFTHRTLEFMLQSLEISRLVKTMTCMVEARRYISINVITISNRIPA